jgi:choline dehydrogenase-like flavoprotein
LTFRNPVKVGILGSGATSISVAIALSEQTLMSVDIEVIDFGITKESADYEETWKKPDLKQAHSSSHVMQIPSEFKMSGQDLFEVLGSAGFGGWAEVWGGTIMRWSEEDLIDWPIGSDDLNSSWDFTEMKLKRSDEITNTDYQKRVLPNFVNQYANKERSADFDFGPSELAISPFSDAADLGCTQCGQCLSGCPWGHIWSPSRHWDDVLVNQSIKYFGDLWVEKIKELDDRVIVQVVDSEGYNLQREYDIVFIGLGAVQTGSLLMRSGLARENVEIKDSQMVIMPFLLSFFRSTGGLSPRISLSDAFFRTVNKDQGRSFYCQIYGYSKVIDEQVVAKFPILGRVPQFLRRIVLQRIGVAMCFLDGDQSGSINLSVADDGYVTASRKESQLTKKQQINQAKSNLKRLGVIPLPIVADVPGIGKSYHLGASFPMGRLDDKVSNFSDRNGRPNGTSRLHIIDSSVFTTMSATPPTFNAMANARRIALNIAKEFGNRS